jgi:hypothetical protein
VPDSRRRALPRGPKQAERLAEAAKALWDQDLLMQDIA